MKSAKHIMVDKMTIETRNKHIYSQCKLKKKTERLFMNYRRYSVIKQ